MNNTISALWHGEINPEGERVVLPQEALEAKRYFERNKEKLLALLDEQGKELLEKVGECNNEMVTYELEDAFVKGFSLGARLMAEAMTAVK